MAPVSVVAGQRVVPPYAKAGRLSASCSPSPRAAAFLLAALRWPSDQITAAPSGRLQDSLSGFLPAALGPAQCEHHLPLLGFQMGVCQLCPFIPPQPAQPVPGVLELKGGCWFWKELDKVFDPPAAFLQMLDLQLPL